MTVSTFFPDGAPETTSVDGWAERGGQNEAFGTIRAGAGSFFNDDLDVVGMVMLVTTATSPNYNSIRRGVFLFDTSSLPDTDTIDAVTFEFVATAKADEFTEAASLSMVTSTPASNTALENADYTQLGTTKQATDLTIASVVADSATYNAFTLNATGRGNISQTGISKFGARGTFDNDNVEPTWGASKFAYVNCASAEEVLAGDKRPKLVVTHTATADPEGSLLGGKLLRGGLLQHGVLVRH